MRTRPSGKPAGSHRTPSELRDAFNMRRNAILDRFARDAQYIPCPVWVTRSGANDVCGAPLVAYAWPYPSGASRQSPIEVRCANDHIGHFARPDKQWEYRPGSVVEKWLLSENVALADWDRLADVYREPYARSARYDTSPDKTAREAYVTARRSMAGYGRERPGRGLL
jgi:hypothetical protein